METFQPSEPPLIKQLLLHPAFHIALIVTLVFLTVTYIKQRENRSFLSRVEKIPKGPSVLEKNPSPPSETSPPEATPPPVSESTPAPSEPPSQNPALPVATAGSVGTSGVSASTGPGPGQAALVAPSPSPTAMATDKSVAATDRGPTIHMKVLYAEVDTTTLGRWVPRMQASGQFASSDFKMGVLPDIQREVSSDRSIVVMDTVEKTFDNSHTTQDWFIGKNEADTALGFRTRITMMGVDRFPLRAEIRMIRVLETTDPRSFEADFELPAKAGWTFWDIAPNQYRPPEDEILNPQSFFQIFKSPRFKSNRTSFTMLFLFDKPSSK